jgi:very-short-patch-repair endonuclease
MDIEQMKDTIDCKICNKEFKQITETHLKKSHGIYMLQYKEMFPGVQTKSELDLFNINQRFNGQPRSAEHQANLNASVRAGYANGREANKGMLGKTRTEEAKQKALATRAVNGYRHSEETKAKIGVGNLGKTMSEGAIERQKAGAKLAIERNGGVGFNKGLKYDPIHGQKLSVIAKARTEEDWGAKVEAMWEAKRNWVPSDQQRENHRNGRIKYMSENPQQIQNTGGERQIASWLESKGIIYRKQWTITPHGHPYDFYLPDYNTLIEFDGRHHWDRVWFDVAGLTELEKQIRLDEYREIDAINNLKAGKAGYKVIRLQGWTTVGDAPGLLCIEEQLKQQGFIL